MWYGVEYLSKIKHNGTLLVSYIVTNKNSSQLITESPCIEQPL